MFHWGELEWNKKYKTSTFKSIEKNLSMLECTVTRTRCGCTGSLTLPPSTEKTVKS